MESLKTTMVKAVADVLMTVHEVIAEDWTQRAKALRVAGAKPREIRRIIAAEILDRTADRVRRER